MPPALRCYWDAGPNPAMLAEDEVHVWAVDLEAPTSAVSNLESLLSVAEQEKAGRFHFDHDRRRFIASRACLRVLAGRYLGIPPEQPVFSNTDDGKPFLAGSGLEFNLSHSHQGGLLAFSLARPVGVDLERMDARRDLLSLARFSFSEQEQNIFTSLPADQQTEAFYNAWTRKEAYVKALGKGLALPLDSFDVSLRPGEAARLLGTDDHHEKCGEWQMHSLNPFPGYRGAIIAAGDDWKPCCFALPDLRG